MQFFFAFSRNQIFPFLQLKIKNFFDRKKILHSHNHDLFQINLHKVNNYRYFYVKNTISEKIVFGFKYDNYHKIISLYNKIVI